jgi:HEAT repeat protein
LSEDGAKRETVAAVAENLRHSSPLVRQEAVATMDALGPLAADHLPELVVALSDSSGAVRRAAAFACGNLARDPELVLPELLPVLKDANLTTASAAAWAVGRYGKTASDAAPALVRLVRMGAVKCEAVFVDEVLESLVAVCDDPEAVVVEQLAKRDEESCRRVLDTLAAWRVRTV